MNALARALRGFDHCASPWTTLATVLLDRTRMASRLAESGDLADRVRGIAIWQLMNFVRAQPAGPGLPITRLLERVRRLVRLGDDRDLRQLPAAVQGLDAVRLMTIHGAKGLEFPVTHIHGLNADTIPRKSPTPGCPAPEGMIEGGEGNTLDLLRAGHDEEQECLFYVALSRARDRLFLYAPTQKSNGHRRPLSPFVDRLGSNLIRRVVVPSRALPSAAETDPIPVAIEGNLCFTAPQIALYERCPRRFFYTHMLRVGGRRTATSFMQLHEAVRTVVDEIIAVPATISDDVLSRRARDAMAAHGLSDHGYRDQFQELAVAMLRFFVASRDGYRTNSPVAISLEFGEERVEVRPDDVLVRPDGGHILRRIRTGHMRSAEKDDVAAAAFVLAAQRAFPDAEVQLVHLSDAEVRPIKLTSRKLQTRRDRLAGYLADIRRGHFTPKVSSRTCPSCPSFFICGPTPGGVLTKKFA